LRVAALWHASVIEGRPQGVLRSKGARYAAAPVRSPQTFLTGVVLPWMRWSRHCWTRSVPPR
jgi:hypothetical protein